MNIIDIFISKIYIDKYVKRGKSLVTWGVQDDTHVSALGTRRYGATIIQERIRKRGAGNIQHLSSS